MFRHKEFVFIRCWRSSSSCPVCKVSCHRLLCLSCPGGELFTATTGDFKGVQPQISRHFSKDGRPDVSQDHSVSSLEGERWHHQSIHKPDWSCTRTQVTWHLKVSVHRVLVLYLTTFNCSQVKFLNFDTSERQTSRPISSSCPIPVLRRSPASRFSPVLLHKHNLFLFDFQYLRDSLVITSCVSEPTFVSSSLDPDGRKLYFFFSEVGKEFRFPDELRTARVAQICKVNLYNSWEMNPHQLLHQLERKQSIN